MKHLEQVLDIVREYIDNTNKRTKVYQILLNLKEDIKKLEVKLEVKEDKKAVSKETPYHCAICKKISLRLRNNRYCIECFDKFID